MVTARDHTFVRYAYSSDPQFPHNLTDIYDAAGVQVLHATYDVDDATDEGTEGGDVNDEGGHLTQLTDASGQGTDLSFSALLGGGQTLSAVTDPGGMTVEDVRDSRGDVVRHIQALDKHDADISAADRRYLVTVYQYNLAGLVSAESVPFLVTGEENRLTQAPAGPDVSPSSWAQRTSYDAQGRVLQSIDALGAITSYQYDDQGRLIATTDPLGDVTHNLYDDIGELLETWITQGPDNDPANPEVKLDHTRNVYQDGQLVATYQVPDSGPEVLVSSSTYDSDGRMASSTDAAGVTTYYHYDQNGNQNYVWHNQTDETTGFNAVLATYTQYDVEGRATETQEFNLNTTIYTVTDFSDLYNRLNPPAWPPRPTPVPISTTHTHYNDRNQVDYTIDQYNTETDNLYNVRGDVIETRTQAKDASGAAGCLVTRTLYDDQGRATFVTDPYFVLDADYPAGADVPVTGTHTVYDELGRAVRSERYEGVTIELVNDPGHSGLKMTQSSALFDGHTNGTLLSYTQTDYDPLGRVEDTIVSNNPGVPADAARTDYYYDATGRQIGVLGPVVTVDGRSERALSESVYNLGGRLVQSNTAIAITDVSDPHPDITDTSIRDESAMESTWYEYDAAGRQTAVVSAAVPDPAAPQNQVHVRTETEYDSLGRKVAVREDIEQPDPLSTVGLDTSQARETNYEYNAAGQLTAVVLPAVPDPANGNALEHPRYEYTYDAYGNQTAILADIFQIDPADPTTISNRSYGHETLFTYDAANNQTSHSLPMAGTTWNANDFVERSYYDNTPLASIAAPLTVSVGLGELKYSVDFEGHVTAYFYDNSPGGGGRLAEKCFYASETVYAGGSGTPGDVVSYTYDPFGRVVTIAEDTNGDGTIERTTTESYDAFGRLICETSPEGTIHYEYDPATGLMTRTYTGLDVSVSGDGKPMTDTRYGYDTLGRLVSVTVVERNHQVLATPEETDYRYDLAGNLEQEWLPNGTVSDYHYDSLNRLVVLRTYKDVNGNKTWDSAVDQLLTEFDYTLSLDGKRTAATEKQLVDSVMQDTQINWLYDALGRLTREASHGPGTGHDYITDYTYDLVGNRLTKKTDHSHYSADPAYTPTYDETITDSYDNDDRLRTEAKVEVNASASDTCTVYAYGSGTASEETAKTMYAGQDASGAVLEQDSYSFDLAGRMSGAVEDLTGSGGGVTTSSYGYADDDTRVSQTVNGVQTVYLVDRDNPTGYSQVLEEKDSGGNVTKTYTLGQDVIAQQAPAVQSGGTLYLLYDGHGSTRGLVDATGQPLTGQVFRYDAFGNRLDSSTALTTLLYSGEQTDGTGLQYLRARYYDPAVGRFNSLDPFAGDSSDPQSLHQYLYCDGSPITLVDPSGNFPGFVGTISRAILGTYVHTFIGSEFKSHSPKTRWANQFIRTIAKNVGGSGGYLPVKPDLAEADSGTNGTIYEIKPGEITLPWAPQAWSAVGQLGLKLLALNLGTRIPWSLGRNYASGITPWPEFSWAPAGWELVTFSDYTLAPGVLLYDFVPTSVYSQAIEAVGDIAVSIALLQQLGAVSQALAQIQALGVSAGNAIMAELKLQTSLSSMP